MRQGCPLSPLLFLLVMEALLISIRDDPCLTGIRIATHDGDHMELRERCMADDTMVYLQSADQVPRLLEILAEFEAASGQKLNADKSIGVVLGDEADAEIPADMAVKMVNFGNPLIEPTLGV